MQPVLRCGLTKREGFVILYVIKKYMEVRFIRNVRKFFLLLAMCLGMLCFTGTVQASAKTVNAVTSAKTVTGGKWVTTKSGKKYRYANGTYAKSAWLKINGSIYRINKNGIRMTGWFTVSGTDFYASKTGKLYVKRWLTAGSSRYYFQASGACAKGKWLQISGKYYYFLNSGKMATNRMVKKGSSYYYVNKSGVRVKSTWVVRDGKKYYFDKSGVRVQKKWLLYGGKYYYLGSDGVMAVSQWINDTYYVDETGARVTDSFVDGYYLDETGKKTVINENYIFVGDSRMVGMQQSVASSDVKYIAKISQGYTWLNTTAGKELKRYLKAKPQVTVVLALGVNDLGNIGNYISYYQALITEFPDTVFYVLSVNPVDDKLAASKGYKIKNSDITAFNKKLKAAFSDRYINTYTFMKTNMETSDGVHYTAATYQALYSFLMDSIKTV